MRVWTKQQSGFYYCEGGTLFGDKPGEMMTQGEALMTGYRPADGTCCQNAQRLVASADKPPTASQPPGATDGCPTAGGSSAPGSGSVSVWAIQDAGLYFCRGDILFGSRPGKLVMQSEAVSAAYIPSVGTYTYVQSRPVFCRQSVHQRPAAAGQQQCSHTCRTASCNGFHEAA